MCVPVQWVGKDGSGRITHVGGATAGGTAWGLSVAEAVAAIESREWDFFTEVSGAYAIVVVRETGGSKHLTTVPDGQAANNLDALPVEPRPFGGTFPTFPLSLPGLSATTLSRITRIRHGENGQWRTLFEGELGVGFREFEVPNGFFDGDPKRLYLDVMVPFPAQIGVSDPIVLTQVDGDFPSQRYAEEDAGRGWWTLSYVMTGPDGAIDPALPARITPARIVVRPTVSQWRRRRVGIAVISSSINVHCYFGGKPSGGPAVGFVLKEAAAPAPPAAPTTVTVPNVIGVRLDGALTTLWNAGFKVTLIGPVDVNTNLEVESQSLTPGSQVRPGSGIILTTRQITAPTGVKALQIENVGNRQVPLDIWLFDYTAGGWSKQATIAYGARDTVEFEEGHVFGVAAVDPTMPYCSLGNPEDSDCVYATPTRQFAGDDDGVTLSWVIT